MPDPSRAGMRIALKELGILHGVIPVTALSPEKAAGAFLPLQGTDDLSEGVTENSPEGGALVGGEDCFAVEDTPKLVTAV